MVKKKGKGSLGLRGKGTRTSQMTVAQHGRGARKKVLPAKKEDLDVPLVEEPCAQLAVTLGYTMAQNYQSVTMQVQVSLPWSPDDVQGGLECALEEADTFIADNAETMEEALKGLADKA